MCSVCPTNETARVQALRSYALLDTDPEPAFDDLAKIASQICDAPIALVVLLDERRQWFKARVGTPLQETPREVAFCAQTILQTEPLVIEDATLDPRFSDNPFVTAPQGVRFYAGAPLIDAQGFALGTLCVVDVEPRQLLPEQLDALQALSRQVVGQMQLRRAAAELAEALHGMRVLQELIPMCSWCKSIRTDEGYWAKVEEYLQETMGAELTHGICPSCTARYVA
ncbi:MAG: GAF domain-containing protein [Deltaproteobacteria bacterium]|nr:MAG: GAF domain-containing protein [Deltaproteobacteria bacterium]